MALFLLVQGWEMICICQEGHEAHYLDDIFSGPPKERRQVTGFWQILFQLELYSSGTGSLSSLKLSKLQMDLCLM